MFEEAGGGGNDDKEEGNGGKNENDENNEKVEKDPTLNDLQEILDTIESLDADQISRGTADELDEIMLRKRPSNVGADKWDKLKDTVYHADFPFSDEDKEDIEAEIASVLDI